MVVVVRLLAAAFTINLKTPEMKMTCLPSLMRLSLALPILIASILAVLLLHVSHADVLDQYNFGPDGTTPGVLTPTAVGLYLTASSITADAGLLLDLTNPATQPTTTPYLRTAFVITSTTQEAAFTNNADFKFTLTADTGYLLNLTALDFDATRGGASTPRGYAVRTSVDGFASVLGTADLPTVRPTFTHVNLSLAGAAFQNLSTITFNIYSYSPATGSAVDYDSVVVSGTTQAVPEPGATGLLLLGAVGMLGRCPRPRRGVRPAAEPTPSAKRHSHLARI